MAILQSVFARELPGGLVLRPAGPADLDQIAALLASRGEPADAVDHRLVVNDPAAGFETCAVVVDGDRVVSTATLLDEELELSTTGMDDPVRLPAGQVELVATDVEYEGRGLVRELMHWAHQLSASRGHVVQVMIGIPYFYRQFGYSYAIDIARRRPLTAVPDDGRLAAHEVRPATAADLSDVARLQRSAQNASSLRMPHSPPRWRWLIEHDGSTTWVVVRSGAVVATGRTTPPEHGVLLCELAASDHEAAFALVAHAHRLAHSVPDARELRIAERPATVVDDLVRDLTGPPASQADQYYVRVPDHAALFDLLRPVLDARLARAGVEAPEEVVVSTFRRHLRLPVVGGRFGSPIVGGPMQAPGSVGGAGVAPDQIGPLLFGPHGIVGLSERHPDVYPGRHADLMAALFPPVSSDLLTFYVP
ncbi:MAG TPA: GNAT family N-acetyltransferase [Actinomycetales bacterium]|nr:GNAT family N-acetyltransferase [Actinomycetales bacterium]